MDMKDTKTLMKIFLLIGIILCGVSLIVPWGESSLEPFGKVTFYSWGLHTTSTVTSDNQWSIYIPSLFNESVYSGLFSREEIETYAIPFVLSIFVMPLSILSLVCGIIAEEQLKKKSGLFLNLAGGVPIIAVVLFFMFIQFGVFSTTSGLVLSLNYEYSTGLYSMIAAAIVFISSYFIIDKLKIE